MALVITWRNPFPSVRTESTVRRALHDRFGTLYVVTGPDATQDYFELFPGGGATSSDKRWPEEVESGRMPSRLPTECRPCEREDNNGTTQEENGDSLVCGRDTGKQSHEAEDPGA
jgi:hypothetical protein